MRLIRMMIKSWNIDVDCIEWSKFDVFRSDQELDRLAGCVDSGDFENNFTEISKKKSENLKKKNFKPESTQPSSLSSS